VESVGGQNVTLGFALSTAVRCESVGMFGLVVAVVDEEMASTML